MKVIFLKDIPRVAKRHDIKEVQDGYALNFLIPKKFAEPASPKTISELSSRATSMAIRSEIQTDLLTKNLEEIKSKVVKIKRKASEKGSLFKAIHEREIVEEMKRQHHTEIAEEFIDLEKPIKEVGEHEVPISIRGKKSSVKLVVERA